MPRGARRTPIFRPAPDRRYRVVPRRRGCPDRVRICLPQRPRHFCWGNLERVRPAHPGAPPFERIFLISSYRIPASSWTVTAASLFSHKGNFPRTLDNPSKWPFSGHCALPEVAGCFAQCRPADQIGIGSVGIPVHPGVLSAVPQRVRQAPPCGLADLPQYPPLFKLLSHVDFSNHIAVMLNQKSWKDSIRPSVYKKPVGEYRVKFGISTGTYYSCAEKEKAPAEADVTFDNFIYAMYGESKELTEEDKNMLLEMARMLKRRQQEGK